jgi:hypothetical protein
MSRRSDRLTATVDALTAAQRVSLPPQANPWAVADALSAITWPEISKTAMTRPMAMTVPACARGRNLITSTLAQASINAWQGTQLSTSPALFDQPDPDLPRAVTIAWTVDDLIFSGVAYWLILDRDVLGYPTAARRIDPNLVDVSTDGIVEGINGQPVSPSDVIVFPGLHEGILAFGARELRTAFTLSDAARRFASVPLPALELHDLSEDGLTAEERLALVDDWTRARELSGVGYTNRSLEVKTHGWSSRDLQLVEARAYAAAEVARVMGIPAAMLDASQSGSSVTYNNLQDARRDFTDYTLSTYTTPIEQRLSMDDISSPGVMAVFDLDSTILRASFADRMAAYEVAITSGVYTVEEIRRRETGTPGTVTR